MEVVPPITTNPREVKHLNVYSLNTQALDDTNWKWNIIIKKIMDIQHQKGPGNIDMFHPTGIK